MVCTPRLHRSIKYLEKPTPRSRDNCPTQEDYEAMMKHATEPFKSMLEFAYETGARPQEVVRMETRHIQGDIVIFSANESKDGKRKRIIYLTDRAKEIILGRPEGYVFKNRDGNQWNHAAFETYPRRPANTLPSTTSAISLPLGCSKPVSDT